jgi:hypothetical protein
MVLPMQGWYSFGNSFFFHSKDCDHSKFHLSELYLVGPFPKLTLKAAEDGAQKIRRDHLTFHIFAYATKQE